MQKKDKHLLTFPFFDRMVFYLLIHINFKVLFAGGFMIHLTELVVIPTSGLFFNLPECECGRCDVSISIDYSRVEKEPDKVYCWVWAQVGDAFIRGLVDELTVSFFENRDKQIEKIIYSLNRSKRFKESLPGFISSIILLDPDSV